jgi:hypothetical protein
MAYSFTDPITVCSYISWLENTWQVNYIITVLANLAGTRLSISEMCTIWGRLSPKWDACPDPRVHPVILDLSGNQYSLLIPYGNLILAHNLL